MIGQNSWHVEIPRLVWQVSFVFAPQLLLMHSPLYFPAGPARSVLVAVVAGLELLFLESDVSSSTQKTTVLTKMTILFSLCYCETWQKIRSGFGINKQTANPLQLDKNFIEVSSCGTVYFSKGGNSNFDDFPPHKTVPCKIPYVLGPIFIRSRRILKTSQFHLIRNNKSIYGGGFPSKMKTTNKFKFCVTSTKKVMKLQETGRWEEPANEFDVLPTWAEILVPLEKLFLPSPPPSGPSPFPSASCSNWWR